MKKFTQLLSILCLASFGSNTLFAQSKYASIHAGYGFKSGSQTADLYNITANSTTYTEELINTSLGKGVSFGGNFGYMFNDNIGLDLGISYLIGGKTKATEIDDSYLSETTVSSKMLRINPSLVISSNLDKMNPYAKFGMLIGSGSVMNEFYEKDDADETLTKLKENAGLALGLTAGIGVHFKLSDKMSFCSELTMINLSYAPTKGEIIECSYNGKDELPNLTASEKKFIYVDSITHDFNAPSDSEPSYELKEKYPFDSIGLNIGLRFKL